MLYTEKPFDFNSRFEVGSCFIENAGEILLLERQKYKPQGGTYGVPAGKIEPGEFLLEGTHREVKQETGLDIGLEKFSYFKTVYVKYPEFDFVYYMFHILIESERPKVQINSEEHNSFRWIAPKLALDLPLILELDTCIKMFYNV